MACTLSIQYKRQVPLCKVGLVTFIFDRLAPQSDCDHFSPGLARLDLHRQRPRKARKRRFKYPSKARRTLDHSLFRSGSDYKDRGPTCPRLKSAAAAQRIGHRVDLGTIAGLRRHRPTGRNLAPDLLGPSAGCMGKQWKVGVGFGRLVVALATI